MKDRSLILWIGLGLAVLLGLIWQFYPLPDAKERIEQLPLSGPGFSGYNIDVTPAEASFFENVNMVKRIYDINGQKVFIYVLDGTHNRHAVHDPTYCFRGGGFEIATENQIPIPGGGTAQLYHLVKQNNGQKKEALLWFSNGKEHYNSPLQYWLEATLRRLTLGWSGPEPVLIVVQPVDKPFLDAKSVLDHFPALLKI